MSMDYWPIAGYGVEIEKGTFDSKKVAALLEEKYTGEDDYEYDFPEFLGKLLKDTPFVWTTTADMWNDQYWYVMLTAALPGIKQRVIDTIQEVNDMLMDVLRPYLDHEIDEATLRSQIETIQTVGCG
jgi:predicted RNase H-like HicB family nuclease